VPFAGGCADDHRSGSRPARAEEWPETSHQPLYHDVRRRL
jgi:hypothetical protein